MDRVEFVSSGFLQAESGIREAQESRGLGDVYKSPGSGVGVAAGCFTSKTGGAAEAGGV